MPVVAYWRRGRNKTKLHKKAGTTWLIAAQNQALLT